MSPLWNMKKVKLLQLINKKPSPKQYSDFRSFAQGSGISRNWHFFQFNKHTSDQSAIKGTSLFISLRGQVEASMTVEASIVLPLFVIFFLNLSCAIELIRLHGNLEFALRDVGNRLAVYGYAFSEQGTEALTADENLWDEVKDIAVSYTFIKNEMVQYVGEGYLQEGPIAGGVDGLQFWESEIFGDDDCVEIIVTYRASPFVGLTGFNAFSMANRYYGHVWSGYRIPGTEQVTDVVYVAENGVVYHEDRACSFLLLSIRRVSLEEAYESCNIAGERYTPCMRCYEEKEQMEFVYITDNGENIHGRKDCGSLKRTVHTLPREEAVRYRACRRCAQN